MIVAYVSSHGFGHATRTAEVLRRVRALHGEMPITVVSTAPERFFQRAIPGGVDFRSRECDIGLVQKDALTIDVAATAERWKSFAQGLADLVDGEWRFLRHSGARLVFGDIPPSAFQAAHEAGVRSIALGNFSWDWIYAHYGARQPALRDAAQRSAEAYARASLLLRLPFSGPMDAFTRVEPIALIARQPGVARAEARRRLGLGGETVVLVTFGGFGLSNLDPALLAAVPDCVFLVTDASSSVRPSNVRVLRASLLDQKKLGYEDVVGLADVVLTKPGYGIVSDAIGAGVRVVYTDRGDFPEYEVLAREMGSWLACVHLPQAELRAGRLGEAIRTVLTLEPPPAPDLSGAEVAARWILDLAARGA